MTIIVKSTTFLFSCGTSESKVCTDSLDIWRAQGPRVSFFRPSVFHTGNIWKHLETFFYTCMSDSSHSSHSSHSTGSRQWRRLLSVTESETLRFWDPYVYCTVATIVETEARYMLHACMTCMYDIHDAAPYDAVAIFKENDSWKTDVSDAPDASDTWSSGQGIASLFGWAWHPGMSRLRICLNLHKAKPRFFGV